MERVLVSSDDIPKVAKPTGSTSSCVIVTASSSAEDVRRELLGAVFNTCGGRGPIFPNDDPYDS
jgi:hypothetical protein